MDQIKLTRAAVEDYNIVQEIGRGTFYETFAQHNTEENMQRYLAESFSEVKIIGELSNVDSQFYLAWDQEEVIAYLKLNTGNAQTELQDPQALEIERIYVKGSYHGKRIGQLLFEKALAVAREISKTSVWLGVWEHNTRAISFYEKNGFVAFDQHIFTMGNEVQTDIMMRKIFSG